ncbi:uncharacterized protein M6B38_281920 [Iris pallida]|uniref:Transcription termination factor MTERF2, chloroplastic n=1 Tax=Iris pallida TaxID=29817 RepID=A0AAX6I163_IRIPA|nr:uncharacterized protein M6B38_281920 [Iris pallida]
MPALSSHSPITTISSLFSPSIASLPAENLLLHRSPQCPRVPRIRLRARRSAKTSVQCSGAGKSQIPPPKEEEGSQAREVLFELLKEFGASEEESIQVASNSPSYVASLVEDVLELDSHSLWGSWSVGEDASSLSFKRKVYLMAKSKGDGGLLPFLESIGLKHSSSMIVARYLSTERLPELITKVKFVKEILFSSNSLNELIGRNARRMMMHISVPIDDDIQRTLSFFEKMEANQGGLDKLGYEEASFSFLIESFPKLLLLSLENCLKPLVDFLILIGVPKERVRHILLSFPPIFFYDIEREIKPRMSALEKAGFKYEDIARMLLKYPWILSTSIIENYEKILSFFNEKKVPESSVDLAIKSWPHLLGCTANKMMPIVDQFGDLGVNKKMLGRVISSSPQLLLRKPNEFLEVVSFMEEIGFDGKTTGRILCRCPEIFAASVDTTIRKKVDFLTDFGILRSHISRVIRKYPELLLLDIHNTLLPRMRYLMDIGLSKRDVCSMVCKFSPLLGYSVEVVLEPKLEFLLRTMQKPLKEIVEYPRYFSYSLEKRIKPRFWVLKSRNIDCSLKDMLGKNDEEFAEQYMGIEFGRLLVVPSPAPSDNGS